MGLLESQGAHIFYRYAQELKNLVQEATSNIGTKIVLATGSCEFGFYPPRLQVSGVGTHGRRIWYGDGFAEDQSCFWGGGESFTATL